MNESKPYLQTEPTKNMWVTLSPFLTRPEVWPEVIRQMSAPNNVVARKILPIGKWEALQKKIVTKKVTKISWQAEVIDSALLANGIQSYLVQIDFKDDAEEWHRIDVQLPRFNSREQSYIQYRKIDFASTKYQDIYNQICNDKKIPIDSLLNIKNTIDNDRELVNILQTKLNNWLVRKVFEQTVADYPEAQITEFDHLNEYLYKGQTKYFLDYALVVNIQDKGIDKYSIGINSSNFAKLQIVYDIAAGSFSYVTSSPINETCRDILNIFADNLKQAACRETFLQIKSIDSNTGDVEYEYLNSKIGETING